jgi:DNA polymerase III subunit alpha
MANRQFAHLHLHTHYSLLDGFNRIPVLVEQTKKLGMNAVAITDHGNLYGAIEFYEACKKGGINPIIGYEAYLAPNDRREKTKSAGGSGEASSHLTLLAQNAKGFQNLVKLSSIAFLEGFYYKPRIDREVLEAHSEGLICLSGCLAGEFNQHILHDRHKEAKKLAEYFARLFGENFFIEIQNNGIGLQDVCTPVAAEISDKLGVPLVATADAHYLCAEDATAHDIYFCINTKRLHDPRKRTYPEEKMPNPYFVRSPADMYKLFPDYADAVQRSQQIADTVDIQLDFNRRVFPVFKTPRKLTADAYLRELCLQGITERYGDTPDPKVFERLEIELGVISHMGYAAYFLIVWDFVRFAREKGIPSTARGSGVGAIVSYVLYISHVCPIEYDLLFERFLDKSRKEPPDIDIDFCQERREDVIQYVKEKYGHDSVAQIGTFGTLAAKAALKDVGRVLNIPLERVNYMCKLVPMKGAIALDLADAMGVPDFKKEYDNDPSVKHWVDIARKLEGMNRNVGTHAAGVVISSGPITDYVPVQRVVKKDVTDLDKKAGGEVVITTQWEMGILEKVGMLKMDFLGLRNLTVLDKAVLMIERIRGIKLDPQTFPLDDAATYQLLQRGDAKGVFQLESDGIRELLKQMKPDNIRDLIAVLALYRPGPLKSGMVDSYVNRKHGREQFTYEHPVLKDVLSETYNVLVYQEQIMRILNRLGGIELSKSYAVIKAISKKVVDKIESGRKDFVSGAQTQGLTEDQATAIFENIVNFAEYGFNKSHTTAYAMIGYQTAYLKTHYTAEFMAALLSSEIDDGNKRDIMVEHIADARKLGVDVEAPDINKGQPDFDVVNGKIVFGLTAIKGLGRGAAEEIVRVREKGGPYRDLFDFCERVDTRNVKQAQIEKVIKAGAMDCFGKNKRNAMHLSVGRAMQSADGKADDRRRGQKNMFDMFGGEDDGAADERPGALPMGESLPDVTEWPELERLKFEKEVLDFYMSSHPLAQFEDQLRRYRTHQAGQIGKLRVGTEVRLAGMITELLPKVVGKGRNAGNRWAIVRLEDFSGSAKCILWSDQFARFGDDVKLDSILLLDGKLESRDSAAEPDIIVERVMTLEMAKSELTRGMILRMNYTDDAESTFDAVGTILKRARGNCPVYLAVFDPAGKAARFKLNAEFFVNPMQVAVDQLEMLLGTGSVIFSGQA